MPKYSVLHEVTLGKGTHVHDHVNLYRCTIGKHGKIDAFVYIEEGVVIGDYCKIRPFVFIPTGVTIGNHVFIGPHVTFTNDKTPRAQGDWTLLPTVVYDNVSIGAHSVILPGVTIHEHALIGAGSVVTRDVPAHAIVVGNPAQVIDHRT